MSANTSDIPSCASQLHTRLSPLVWHRMKRMPSSVSSNAKFAYRFWYSAYLVRLATGGRYLSVPDGAAGRW